MNKASSIDSNVTDVSSNTKRDKKSKMHEADRKLKGILKPPTKFPPAVDKPKIKLVRGIRKNFLRAVGKMPPRQYSRNNPNIDMFKINKNLRKSLQGCPDIGEVPVAFSGNILEHEIGEGSYLLHRSHDDEEEEEDYDSDESQSNFTNKGNYEQSKLESNNHYLDSGQENIPTKLVSRFKQMKMAERNES